MRNDKIVMIGKKSNSYTSFAVFESLSSWRTLREMKVIPVGHYFAVLVVNDRICLDVRPDLFVQGYRPHSSSSVLHVDRRRYGEFVREARPEFKDDVVFCESQLYQVKGELEVELVLGAGEASDVTCMEGLVQRICAECGYNELGKLGVYSYECKKSVGYFLAGRKYKIWATVVGKVNELSMSKKILIFEYETGIPALIDFDTDCLSAID